MRTFAVIGLVVASALCLAKDKSLKPADVIDRAAQFTDIRAEGQPAFHLKAEFTYFAEDRTIQGTYLEDWVSSRQWRRETTGANTRELMVAVDKKRWTVDEGHGAAFLHEYVSGVLIVRPSDAWKKSTIHRRKVDGGVMFCLDDSGDERCFDEVTGLFMESGRPNSVCNYTNYQKFGEKTFPRLIRCTYQDRPVLDVRVTELGALNKVDASLYIPPDGSRESLNCLGKVEPAKVLTSAVPTYFEGTNSILPGFDLSHFSGVFVRINANGKTEDMTVVRSSRNKAFEESFLDNVRKQWRFEPATCDGKAMESTIVIW